MGMTREEVVKWLESLKKEIGKAENRTLWHYAESIDMAIEASQFAEHFDLLKEFQSLQEVVRCKDCRYMTEHYDTDGNAPYWTCSEWDSGTDYDGFCHYGERKEE